MEELYNTNVAMWVRFPHLQQKSRLINWLEFLQQVYLYLIIRLGSSVVEHWIEAPGVVGAIPTRGTQYETVTNS